VLFDPRGVGSSTAPTDGDYSVARHVDDVETIRRAIGVEKVHLLGHSFGGLVAMEYVTRFPEHMRSIAFVGSVPPADKELGPTLQAMQNAMKERTEKGLMAPPPPPEGSDGTGMFRAIMPGYFADPKFAIPAYALETRYGVMIASKTSASAKGYDHTADMKAVKVPVMVMAGEADAFAAVVGSLAAAFRPGIAAIERLPACGTCRSSSVPLAFSMCRRNS
jgi:pimeloyl-ACP methyl ester carboxylesterase